MSEQQPAFHRWFHSFLIYFAMWVYALIAVLYGAKHILHAMENNPEYKAVVVIVGVLLIILGAFTVKVRFDLAAFKPGVPGELLVICVAAAVIILIDQLLAYYSGEESSVSVISVIVFICWGISLKNYYGDRPYMFRK